MADEACEEALLDSTALRRFVGIDLGCERVPDGTTLLKFRRLLEKHQLGEKMFATAGQELQARALKEGTGTIVDATIGVRQGALPWAGQERHALVRGVGPGKHLLGASTPDGMSAPAARAKGVREAKMALMQPEIDPVQPSHVVSRNHGVRIGQTSGLFSVALICLALN